MKKAENISSQYRELKNKRVLITGINGFIGSHLARELRNWKAEVYGVSLRMKGRNILNANILNFLELEKFVRKNNIQLCFHLAGRSLVEAGQENPFDTFSVNVQGTLNLLELSRKYRFERLIIASSSHVYGKNRVPYYEGYTPRPSRPYETSKACTDLIAQSYAETFGLPIFITRFVNVYGPGDLNFRRIIPYVLKHLSNSQPISLWGGDAVRDYLYISDAIDAYMRLAVVKPSIIGGNKIFNFGGGSPIKMKDLLREILKRSENKLIVKRTAVKRRLEIKEQYVSFAKAKKVLAWQPKVPLDVGLTKSIAWYKNYFSENKNILLEH